MNSKIIFAGLVMAISSAVSFAQTERLLERPNAPARISAAGDSYAARFSPDGKYVLFASDGGDLTGDLLNGKGNVFLCNLTTGATQLVTSSIDNVPGNGDSEPGGISLDNKFVVFQSAASNLVLGDQNGLRDIFLRDLAVNRTTLITASAASSGNNGASSAPLISRDGNWIVFESAADNFGITDTNNVSDLYAFKRDNSSIPTFQLVSANAGGGASAIVLGDFEVTADSQNVLFTARGPDLATTTATVKGRVYLRNLSAGATRCVSAPLESITELANHSAVAATISANGRYVFIAATDGPAALARVDLTDDSVVKISMDIDAPTNPLRRANAMTVSDDGQFAVYLSHGAIYRWSAASSASDLVDLVGPGISEFAQISHQGTLIAFLSDKPVLGFAGLYVRDMIRGDGSLISLTTNSQPSTERISPRGFAPDDSSFLFESRESAFVAKDLNNATDVFLWKTATRVISILSTNANPSAKASDPGYTSLGQASADGRRIALTTWTAFDAADGNLLADMYLFDRGLRTNVLKSAGPLGFTASNGSATSARVSGDGNTVAFISSATGLAGPSDLKLNGNVYVRKPGNGPLLTAALTTTLSPSTLFLSDSGQFAFYGVTAANGGHRLDLATLEEKTFSAAPTGVSSDGNRLTYFQTSDYFLDFATNTPVVITNGTGLISKDGKIVVTRRTSSIESWNIETGEKKSWLVSATTHFISDDGKVVAYRAAVSGVGQIGVLNVDSGVINWISVSATGELGNGESEAPVVSPDGKWVAFESLASNLDSSDRNSAKDVFLYDMTGALGVASHSRFGLPANGWSFNPMFADSDTLLFQSTATDLVEETSDTTFGVFMLTFTGRTKVWLDVENAVTGRHLRWFVPKNISYQLEYKSELADSSWTSLGAQALSSGELASYSDSAGESHRYYRLRVIQ